MDETNAGRDALPQDAARQDTPLSLLARARTDDAVAWGRLVGLYRPLVLFWCRRGGLIGPDAEDVGQEVFAAASASLPRFRRDRPGDTFRGWLRGITRNQVLMHRRRNRGQVCGEGGDDAWEQMQGVIDPILESDDEAAEVGQLFRRVLDLVRQQFEESTWHAFWLTVIEGRAPAALADELSMSPAAIRQAKSRVLRRLKQEVGDVLD